MAGVPSIYDNSYLTSNIEGGELYDYFYADQSARDSQTRTPITDPVYSKPWVFRQKDFKNWWLNGHVNRLGGVETTTSPWVAESKPIIFTQIGCNAADKGSNQPSAYDDIKSGDFVNPYYGSGVRDDTIQRSYLQNSLDYWAPANGNNPISTIYADHMIDWVNCLTSKWDVRPWPTFPLNLSKWPQARSWYISKDITSRLGTANVTDVLSDLVEDYGVTDYDFSRCYGTADGFIVTRPMSFRALVQPLEVSYFFNVIESGSTIKAVSKYETQIAETITLDNVLSQGEGQEVIKITRKQETEIPREINFSFIQPEKDYLESSVRSRRVLTSSQNISTSQFPLVIDFQRAKDICNKLLYDVWSTRETASFGIMPNLLALEVGDVVKLNFQGFTQTLRINNIRDGIGRFLETTQINPFSFVSSTDVSEETALVFDDTASIIPITVFMDLPLLRDDDVEYKGYVASFGDPWQSATLIYRSPTTSNFEINTIVGIPSVIGETTSVFDSGPVSRWDCGNTLDVNFYSGDISSLPEIDVLGGANLIAVENQFGQWELLQFVNAELLSENTYRLSKLLRGRKGTENALQDGLPAGARVVFIDNTIEQVDLELDDLNIPYNYRFGPAGFPITSYLYKTRNVEYTGIGTRPYSVVHLESSRQTNNDYIFTWIRRTRIGGDNWNYTRPIPINEFEELYEIDILNDLQEVVRTLTSTVETVTYTEAQQIADGITLPFRVVVYQISDIYNRGNPRELIINV